MARSGNEQVSYRRAPNFLTANEPEKRLDIRLSYKSFRALEEQALTLYGISPVEYSATDSRVTIYTAPTALHGYSAVNLQQAISFAVYNILVQHQKQELFERIVAVGESTYSSVNDQGRRSTKTPDAGLSYYYDGGTVLTIIMEVGASEGYTHLNADILLWMNEFHCRTAILFYNKECPKFKFPGNADTYSINDRPALEHTWFGTLDTAVLEVFKRDQNTDTCKMVVQGGSLDIGLTIGDVLPPNEDAIQDIRGERVHLRINFVRNMLASGSHDTAVSRFNHFIGED
ncbi:hypothetical protein V1508DRAFT_444645 [Lipomyces doorenjongii]|uniref:uncharacterized protein n=1 Tax=Lipomyces doorenjongii TaxID=383834 RepID=UPI0034CD3AC3